jgi:hypothetical protein
MTYYSVIQRNTPRRFGVRAVQITCVGITAWSFSYGTGQMAAVGALSCVAALFASVFAR